MDRNKVLHITHSDIINDNRILKECKALAEYGYIVYGVGIGKDTTDQHFYAENLKIKSYSFKSQYNKIRLIKHIRTFFLLLRKSNIKRKNTDAMILHCHDLIAATIGFIIKLINPKIILIYDAHELESQKNLQSRFFGVISLLLEKIIAPKTDYLIIVSESIQKWYEKELHFNKTQVILNSPDFSFIRKPNNYLREYFNIPESKSIFIYSGVLNSGRGIFKIIELAKKLEDHFVIIGYGPLEKFVKEEAFKFSNLHFHEKVNQEKLFEILSSADHGLCLLEKGSLSMYYALPNKLFEYLYSNLTIIASDFPEINKVLGNLKAGVVCDVDSEEDILKKIEKLRLLQKPHLIKNLEPYSWSSQKKKLGQIYNDLLDGQ